MWLNTVNSTSWEIDFNSVGFFADNLFEKTRAIVNPGYPFIGVPGSQFEAFKEELKTAYPKDDVICNDMDWCYFE